VCVCVCVSELLSILGRRELKNLECSINFDDRGPSRDKSKRMVLDW
jgi:hypothetical protein